MPPPTPTAIPAPRKMSYTERSGQAQERAAAAAIVGYISLLGRRLRSKSVEAITSNGMSRTEVASAGPAS